jgi:hypothetical protein
MAWPQIAARVQAIALDLLARPRAGASEPA